MASTAHGKLGSSNDMRSVIAQLEKVTKSPPQAPLATTSKSVTPSNKPSAKSSKPPTTTTTSKQVPASPPTVGFKLPSITETNALKRTPGASPAAALKPTPKPSAGLRPITPASKPGAPASNTSSAAETGSTSPGTAGHPVIARKPSQAQPKPTVAGTSSHVTTSVASKTQDTKPNNDSNDNTAATTTPPWQSLVRKPKPAAAATTTTTTPATDSVSSGITESQSDTQTLTRLKSDADKDERASKVKSLRQAFESSTSAQTVISRQKSHEPTITAVKEQCINKDAKQQQQQQQLQQDAEQQEVRNSSPALDCNDNQLKQSNSSDNNKSTLSPANSCNSQHKSFRLRPVPITTTAPPRKPAKPPNVDLGVYIADAFDEVYDDATTVTSRASVVSQIEEYTEEEEERERQLLHAKASPAHEVDNDDDDGEIYDDVGNPDVEEEFDEIYQELD